MNTQYSFWSGYGHWLVLLIVLFLAIEALAIFREKKLKSLIRRKLSLLLTKEWISGRDLRDLLIQQRVSISYRLFFQLMSEFAREKLVLSQDVEEERKGQTVILRHFRLP